MIVLLLGFWMAGTPRPCAATKMHRPKVTEQPGDILSEFEKQVADIWGSDNIWMPSPRIWVRYEHDLGERSAVDFEKGVVHLQILLKADDDPNREIVMAHLRQGLSNLILGEPEDPLEMTIARQWPEQSDISATTLPPGREIRVYVTQPGDSLWRISKQFRMNTETLAKLNGMKADDVLPVGYPIKVVVFICHDLTLDASPRPSANDPVLLDQIRMADGSPVPSWMVREFAAEVVENKPPSAKEVIGADGIERLSVNVDFQLVSNHLEVRARRFQPIVETYAAKYSLNPSLIMAIIHTESMFNPRARSSTPAYGLMQLVPQTGAMEAYRKLYGRRKRLSPQYLYEPENNIELGAAYLSILKNRYMGSILDPVSRMYCAVAAYNAGASNVGRAFVSRKSIKRATPIINRLNPQEVYDRLVDALPVRESRNYVRKVFNRMHLYSEWY